MPAGIAGSESRPVLRFVLLAALLTILIGHPQQGFAGAYTGDAPVDRGTPARAMPGSDIVCGHAVEEAARDDWNDEVHAERWRTEPPARLAADPVGRQHGAAAHRAGLRFDIQRK